MVHVKVKWLHSSPNLPVILCSELDDGFWEIRKVEIYSDGRMDYAYKGGQSGKTRLGIEPLPALDTIAANPEFQPAAMSAEEFETLWGQARGRAQ